MNIVIFTEVSRLQGKNRMLKPYDTAFDVNKVLKLPFFLIRTNSGDQKGDEYCVL